MTKEDLMKFCSTDETRPKLLSPWSEGNYTCATNRYIIVRIPRLEEVPEKEHPDPSDLWAIPLPAERFEIPDIFNDGYKPCEECQGTGKVRYSRGGNLEICPECEGEKKLIDVDSKVTFGKSTFAGWLLALAKTLPGVKIGPCEIAGRVGAWLKFEGGEGFLMGLRDE